MKLELYIGYKKPQKVEDGLMSMIWEYFESKIAILHEND